MIDRILVYKILIEYEPEIIIIEAVIFKVDFGPWRRGEPVHRLEIDFAKALATSYDASGSVTKKGKLDFTCTTTY